MSIGESQAHHQFCQVLQISTILDRFKQMQDGDSCNGMPTRESNKEEDQGAIVDLD